MKQHSKKHYDDVARLSGKERVYASYDPERLGTLTAPGPEVSEIRWDDGGMVNRYLPNKLIAKVGQKLKRRKLAIRERIME